MAWMRERKRKRERERNRDRQRQRQRGKETETERNRDRESGPATERRYSSVGSVGQLEVISPWQHSWVVLIAPARSPATSASV